MPAQGVDTLQINLEQNVDRESAKAASGLDQMADAFARAGAAGGAAGGLEQKIAAVGTASKAVSAELRQQAALEQKIATFDGERAKKVADLKSQYAALNAEATKGSALDQARAASKAAGGKGGESLQLLAAMVGRPIQVAAPNLGGFARLVQMAGDVFGPKGAEAVMGAGRFLAEAGPGLMAAGGALAAAGAVLVAVVVGLGVAAAKLLSAGAKIAIDASTARESAVAGFDRQTGGQGAATYRTAVKLAATLGLDQDDAISQVRALLQAKLDKNLVPLVVRASADLAVDLGDEKAKALREKLAQFGRGKKIDEGAIRGLAEAGVDVNAVFEALRQKGESVSDVMARLKRGGVEGAEAIKAVVAAVEKTSGGAAAKAAESIPGLINRLKIGFTALFDSVDLSPIKDALKSVGAVLEGPVGAELKSALTGLFGQLFHTLFDPFKGPEGKQKIEAIFRTIGTLAKWTTEALVQLAPVVSKTVDLLVALFGTDKGGGGPSGVVQFLAALAQGFLGVLSGSPSQVIDSIRTVLDLAGQLAGVDALGAAIGIGTGIVDGIVQGITSGASRVISSIMSLASTAIAAAKSAFDQHSPSKVFEAIGHQNAAGLAGGHEQGAGKVARSVDAMAVAGIAAASPGSASGGGGAPMSVTFAPQITLAAGSAPEAKAGVEAGIAAAYPQFQAMMRRFLRDSAEMAAT